MQVDLSEIKHLMTSESRLLSQMETRAFCMEANLQNARQFLTMYSDSVINDAIARYNALASLERKYERIGSATCDNLWKLEALGVGRYSKEYVTIIDFSKALDFVLDLQYGCGLECSRDLQNYNSVSSSLLNFDFRNNTDKFGVLFMNSPKLTEEYLKIMGQINSKPEYASCSTDEKMSHFVFKFYSTVLEAVSAVRDTVALELRRQNAGDVVYRSKSYSMAILASDKDLSDELLIQYAENKVYKVDIRSYHRFEWCREEVANELSRNSLYRK